MSKDRQKPFHWLRSPATKKRKKSSPSVEKKAGDKACIVKGPSLRKTPPGAMLQSRQICLLAGYATKLFFAVFRRENLKKMGTKKSSQLTFAFLQNSFK